MLVSYGDLFGDLSGVPVVIYLLSNLVGSKQESTISDMVHRYVERVGFDGM